MSHEHDCPRCGERWSDDRCKFIAAELLCLDCVAAEKELRRRGVDTRELFDFQNAQGRWGGMEVER